MDTLYDNFLSFGHTFLVFHPGRRFLRPSSSQTHDLGMQDTLSPFRTSDDPNRVFRPLLPSLAQSAATGERDQWLYSIIRSNEQCVKLATKIAWNLRQAISKSFRKQDRCGMFSEQVCVSGVKYTGVQGNPWNLGPLPSSPERVTSTQLSLL
jgi:hypothetical protein